MLGRARAVHRVLADPKRHPPKSYLIAPPLLVALAGTLAIALNLGSAGADQPGPEPNFAGSILPPRPCAYDTKDPYEKQLYVREGWSGPDYVRYPGACERLRFAYGPLLIKPGQNDVLITPVTIDKPLQDGYITRFKPNLVDQNGHTPPVEQIHLHHGTWLSIPSYGNGPFFAAGEEKTIAPWPRGYGLPIKKTDTWLMLYMVHSAVPQLRVVYITYDVDFIPQAKANQLGLKPAYPVWLDVRPSGYPVFNVQRNFGHDGTCTWPKEECASFDPYDNLFTGQGRPGNGKGTDLQLPKAGDSFGAIRHFTGGTLIGIGGHLHPGGIENEIDLFRPGGENVAKRIAHRAREKRMMCVRRRHHRCVKKKRRAVDVTRYTTITQHVDTTRIYNGRAHYWNHQDPTKDGGPPTSWDFSMEVQGLPYWGVRVQPGDVLRSNAKYDTTTLSSYEDMGIAVALLAPNTPQGAPTAPGVDPFQAKWDWSRHCRSGPAVNGELCAIGQVTHGHYLENGNYSGPSGSESLKLGPETNQVAIANFTYTPGDLTTQSLTGIPRVKLGTSLSFVNTEGLGIYHTITTCKYPCLGPTGSAFPVSNGLTNTGRPLDFDSSELGVGAPFVGATSQKLTWSLPVNSQDGFHAGEIVTYFCRIHPFMRGAFEVAQ
jgi:hypothetical protein